MATPYDPQEQEQLAQIKHFWSRYGNQITWLLIVVLGAIAAWNGWQYWQRTQAVQAATLYDELERAAQLQDVDRVQRVWADIQQQSGSSLQTQQAGLLTAKVLADQSKSEAAQQALAVVANGQREPALAAVARLRLASLFMESGDYAQAEQQLAFALPPEFAGLRADRLGDLHALQGQHDDARQAYMQAWALLEPDAEYRRLIQAKLHALGINPGVPDTGVQP